MLVALLGRHGGFHRVKFVRRTLFVCSASAAAGDFPLSVFTHRRETPQAPSRPFLILHYRTPFKGRYPSTAPLQSGSPLSKANLVPQSAKIYPTALARRKSGLLYSAVE